MSEQPPDRSSDTESSQPEPASSPSDPGSTTQTLSDSTVFDAVSNERRRHVLYYLDERDNDVAMDSLVDWIASMEVGASERVADEHRERIATALHHAHLPRLADIGVIEYDQAARTVTFGEHADEIDVEQLRAVTGGYDDSARGPDPR